MSKISFIKSDDRKYNITRCLSLIKSEITQGLKNARTIVVKPNCVTENNRLAATNAVALEALLEFISPFIDGQIIIAEGTGMGNTMEAFKNFGYLSLGEKFDLQWVDLNTDESEEIELLRKNGKTFKAKFAKTLLNADYLISISPPKTHNEVIYTGAIKNVSVGGLTKTYSYGADGFFLANKFGLNRNYKISIHQGYQAINKNLVSIFNKIPLKLSILDGFEVMEGNGPIDGDMVPAHFAIASSDPIAADNLSCKVLGIDPSDVGYLTMIKELAKHDDTKDFIIGEEWKENISKIKMHPDFEKMKKWQ